MGQHRGYHTPWPSAPAGALILLLIYPLVFLLSPAPLAHLSSPPGTHYFIHCLSCPASTLCSWLEPYLFTSLTSASLSCLFAHTSILLWSPSGGSHCCLTSVPSLLSHPQLHLLTQQDELESKMMKEHQVQELSPLHCGCIPSLMCFLSDFWG